MITLGIESSCDETSVAVLSGRQKLLSNVISSSIKMHQPFGGVVPEIASRHCLEAIQPVYKQALETAGITESQIDLIAVTHAPGLIGSLLVGLSFAKALSYALAKPLVGVHHLEAHLEANFIENRRPRQPFIGLIISGGHTTLLHHDEAGYHLMGETVDDAIGEAYDKSANLLGLGYPGGPMIDRLAQQGKPGLIRFTRPKIKGTFDFSFSGIKTAVRYYLRDHGPLNDSDLKDFCASFQGAVVDWVVRKAYDACDAKQCKYLVTGGGVMANSLMRQSLERESKKRGVRAFIPPMKFTTDNAAMIARRGLEVFLNRGPDDLSLRAQPSLAVAIA